MAGLRKLDSRKNLSDEMQVRAFREPDTDGVHVENGDAPNGHSSSQIYYQ